MVVYNFNNRSIEMSLIKDPESVLLPSTKCGYFETYIVLPDPIDEDRSI